MRSAFWVGTTALALGLGACGGEGEPLPLGEGATRRPYEPFRRVRRAAWRLCTGSAATARRSRLSLRKTLARSRSRSACPAPDAARGRAQLRKLDCRSNGASKAGRSSMDARKRCWTSQPVEFPERSHRRSSVRSARWSALAAKRDDQMSASIQETYEPHNQVWCRRVTAPLPPRGGGPARVLSRVRRTWWCRSPRSGPGWGCRRPRRSRSRGSAR